MFSRLDLCHAVQNMRKYSYITISTLPHVTCVKCNAIAAVDMKTMLDTILLLELELNNQNLANDLDYFDKNWVQPTTIFSMFIEMWRNNGYLGAFISSTKNKISLLSYYIFFSFLGTFFYIFVFYGCILGFGSALVTVLYSILYQNQSPTKLWRNSLK